MFDDRFRWNAPLDRGVPVIVTYAYATETEIAGGFVPQFENTSSFSPLQGFSDTLEDIISQIEASAGVRMVDVTDTAGAAGAMISYTGGADATYTNGSYAGTPFVTGEASTPVVVFAASDTLPDENIDDALLHETLHALGVFRLERFDSGSDSALIKLFDVQQLVALYGSEQSVSSWDIAPETNPALPGVRIIADHQSNLILAPQTGGTIFGMAGNDEVLGGVSDDQLIGGGGDDEINGFGGADTISGGSGADYLIGGAGDDLIRGQEGADRIDGGDGNDIVSGGAGADELFGGYGDDRLNGGAASDVLDGGFGNDVLLGFGGNDLLRGGSGSDTLIGHTGVDLLEGGDGSDTLLGGQSADLLFGGDGGDILFGGSGDDRLFGGMGIDQLNGGANNDYGEGGDGDDILLGKSGNDRLLGGDGNDHLDGGLDDDNLDGGAGTDVLDGGDGNDNLTTTGEGDVLVGGAGDDTFTVSGFAGMVDGGAGLDQADVRLHSVTEDIAVTFDASGPILATTGSTMTIKGIETLNVSLGQGNDIVSGAPVTPMTISGGIGRDAIILDYSSSSDVISVQADWERGSNIVTAELSSGATNSVTFNRFESLNLTGSNGNDVLEGGATDDELSGGAGNDTIIGGGGDDTVDGGAGDDDVRGGNGNDSLNGGVGNDTLFGGFGHDTLTGGAGNDAFVFVFHRTVENDRITDFEAGDTVVLSGYDPSQISQQVSSGDLFVTLDSFVGSDVLVIYNTRILTVQYDASIDTTYLTL